jgi:acetoin utilization deacetylase AcuC-like enzyme
MVTSIVYSKKYLDHNLGPGHPESPARLKAIIDALKLAGYWSSPKVQVIEPAPAERVDIELAHDPEYVELVEKLSKFKRPLDDDTPVNANTFELALLAAGGTIKAGRSVNSGEAKNAFALVRPPGHHAGRAFGGGFCYFNNLAIMAEHLKHEFKLNRIFVFDFDAHHGNGTQDIFYDDPSVLYMSLHQDGRTLYPGTGFVDEIGSGEGEGYTVNVPLPPGSSDEEYASVMQELFIPLTEEFKPELFAVSVGMDSYADDPLTQLQLSTPAYGWLTRYIVDQAEKLCEGRVVLALEGGYSLDALADGNVRILKVLTGDKPPFPTKIRHPSVIDEVKRVLTKYWSF